MTRLRLWAALLAAVAGVGADDKPLTRVAFGSGVRADRPQPVWKAVADAKPDLFVFLGDGAAADVSRRLPDGCPFLAARDGADGGAKAGGYDAKVYGPPGKRVQVILLDDRSSRSPAKAGPNTDPAATVLGDAQWAWLAGQLRQPAELRLIGSATPVVAVDPSGEKWANFPAERERLFKAVRDSRATGVVILSGHRRLAELSVADVGVGYPLFDLTASGLNTASPDWREAEPNRHRVAVVPSGNNFGVVAVDWSAADPEVRLQVRDEAGEVAVQQRLPLSLLKPGERRVVRDAPTGTPPPAAKPAGDALTPAQAAGKVNEIVTVEMAVRRVGQSKDGSRVFLNSENDTRGKTNFTVVILVKGFKGQGAAPTPDAYRGKTVRATGKVTLFNGSPQVIVDDPAKLQTLDR